jgi:hypothetical protein
MRKGNTYFYDGEPINSFLSHIIKIGKSNGSDKKYEEENYGKLWCGYSAILVDGPAC